MSTSALIAAAARREAGKGPAATLDRVAPFLKSSGAGATDRMASVDSSASVASLCSLAAKSGVTVTTPVKVSDGPETDVRSVGGYGDALCLYGCDRGSGQHKRKSTYERSMRQVGVLQP